MSKAYQNHIKANIKREILEQVELILRNHILHAQFLHSTVPSEARTAELHATLAACQELFSCVSNIPETSETAFSETSFRVPHLDFVLKTIIKDLYPVRSAS